MRIPDSMGPRVAALVAGVMILTVAGCAERGDADAVAATPTIVTSTGGTNPTVALGQDSRGYVAWVGLDGDEYNVYLATSDPSSDHFSAPVRVNDIPGDAAPHAQAPAQVAVAPDGTVYVLWQNNTDVAGREYPASDLRLAVSHDGGASFNPAVTVNDDAGGFPSSHTFHDVVVGADGSLVVSWIDSRVRDRLTAEGGHEHSMGEGASDIPGPEIRVARSTDGGLTFAQRTVVDSNACPCCRTSTAIGPDGSVYVAWRKVYPGSIRDIVVARAEPGTLEFGEPVRVHQDGWVFAGCPHAGPALEIGSDGRIHIAWYTGADDAQGLWYAVSDDQAATFSDPTAVLTADWVPPSKAVLARAGSDIWVGWEDQTVEPAVVKLASMAAGGSTTTLASSVEGQEPAIDAESGSTLLAWLDGQSVMAEWAPLPAR